MIVNLKVNFKVSGTQDVLSNKHPDKQVVPNKTKEERPQHYPTLVQLIDEKQYSMFKTISKINKNSDKMYSMTILTQTKANSSAYSNFLKNQRPLGLTL